MLARSLAPKLEFVLDSDASEPSPVAAAPARDEALLDAYSEAVTTVVDTIGPAVMRVDTRTRDGKSGRGGTGSCVVIAPDGLVLTNAHVVNGAGEVRLTD